MEQVDENLMKQAISAAAALNQNAIATVPKLDDNRKILSIEHVFEIRDLFEALAGNPAFAGKGWR